MKTILTIVIMVTMITSLWAQSENDFQVMQNRDNTLTIIGYTGTIRDVVIPETLFGLRVTHIGERAFQRRNLTSVVIPNTIISIGVSAFEGNGLTEITIPDSVIEIGCMAFGSIYSWLGRSCNSLRRVNLGRGVQTIGRGAFGRNEITELTLPASLRTIGEGAFIYNQIRALTIPNGITLIRGRAFAGNPLETLVIPPSLAGTFREIRGIFVRLEMITGIENRAFGDFRYLTGITMPANMHNIVLTNIGYGDQSFINFYLNQNRVAGTYIRRGPIWTIGTAQDLVNLTPSLNPNAPCCPNVGSTRCITFRREYAEANERFYQATGHRQRTGWDTDACREKKQYLIREHVHRNFSSTSR